MIGTRKLPAGAGAEWLLGGVALLRRAPLALGALGALWGVLAMTVLFAGLLDPNVGLALQFLLVLANPLLFAGLLWAVREVDEGRRALPAHLLQGLREGAVPQILATLLPQLVAGLLLGALALVLIGPEQMQQLLEASEKLNALAQAGEPADPAQVQALVADLPAGRILLWLLLAVAAAAMVFLAVFVAMPQILFERRGGLEAMRGSLRAGLRNLPAMAVFFLLTLLALVALNFAAMLLALVLQFLFGPTLAMWLTQLLLMGAMMPLLAGAVYTAWKQLAGAAPPADRIEV